MNIIKEIAYVIAALGLALWDTLVLGKTPEKQQEIF